MSIPQLQLLAPTLEIVGTILIALVVLNVHTHIANERQIDEKVIRDMRRERFYIYTGIVLIIVGYLLETVVRLN